MECDGPSLSGSLRSAAWIRTMRASTTYTLNKKRKDNNKHSVSSEKKHCCFVKTTKQIGLGILSSSITHRTQIIYRAQKCLELSRHDMLGLFFLLLLLLKCCNRSTQWNLAWGTPGLNLSENKYESSKGHPSGIHSLCVGGNVTVTEWHKWGGWDLFPNFSPVLIMTASSHSNLKVICVEGCRTVLLFLWLGFWRTIDVGGFRFACIKITD